MRSTKGFGKMPPSVVRAVVISTYFADFADAGNDDAAEAFLLRDMNAPNAKIMAVSCDVLTYGSRFRAFMQRVPVAQQRHGLNDYSGLWIPRGTTTDLQTNQPYNLDGTKGPVSDPRDLDGDHVLLEFFEGDTQQPFIRSAMPHPRSNFRQLAATGESHASRFRGVTTTVDKDGNVVVDTTRANSGAIDANGAETPALDLAHGNVTLRMNHNAKLVVEGVNAAGGAQKFKIEVDPTGDGLITFRLGNGATFSLTKKDADAIAQLGTGTFNPAVFQHLKTWWESTVWPTIRATFDAHIHPSGAGPTGIPVPLLAPFNGTAGLVAANVQGGKVKFPDGQP
jgi:hypothetical protein